VLLDRLETREERDWYAARAAAEGWTRRVLEHFIKADPRGQLGSAPTNFGAALGAPDSELARQLVKDPYVFEHLAYVERAQERDVEQALMDRLQDTLTEFGRNEAVVRYTLANMTSALGVAGFEGLPAEARAALPSAEELGAVVRDEYEHQKELQVQGDATGRNERA
jgi:predicted nuclease of restriction endonuclease-like (RecB) superfamily